MSLASFPVNIPKRCATNQCPSKSGAKAKKAAQMRGFEF
jgi:hypothetical protein